MYVSAIGAAHDCVKTSKDLQANGHLAHASVKLSLEMLKIANAIREYSGEESGNSFSNEMHCGRLIMIRRPNVPLSEKSCNRGRCDR